MGENDKSLEDIITPEAYEEIKAEVDKFLYGSIKKYIDKVDTIVAAQRKGIRIINEFLGEYPELNKFKLISDMQVSTRSERIKNLNILIFDDAIHTAKKIIGIISKVSNYGPRKIHILCLSINKDAKKEILKKFPKIKISNYKIFDTIKEQRDSYKNWELILIGGLRKNINPDFPNLVLKTPFLDIEKIADLIIESCQKKFGVQDISFNGNLVKKDENYKNITILIKDESKTINDIYNIYESVKIEKEQQKIRCFILKSNNYSEIIITPIIIPSFDVSNCQVPRTSPEYCLYKILESDKDDFFCKICIPYFINQFVIKELQKAIDDSFQRASILVTTEEYMGPELQRFTDHP